MLVAMASVVAALVVAGCGGAPSGSSHAATHSTTPAAQHQTQAQGTPTTSGIPQGNGGDQDADNNGGPSDGDGNI
jgi:hypothetical protein